MSNYSSDVMVPDETFVPIPLVQSTIPSSYSPTVFYLPKSLRWLAPPSHDPSTIVWLETENTPEIILLSCCSSPQTEPRSDIQTIANEILKDTEGEMAHTTEFVNISQEWCKDNREEDNNNSTRDF
ncbi:unnamed protein product [Rotaria sp. Silwood2]|nr:unnamed protein product [Rotaria sp. Silwood2]CAF3159730.1 unnamed protein product [Rotaria sp. Silwood2]CAF4363923.1 unnamed protein product [Rotaria sp. Silwood2]CAF4485785.1 unnamed protein product [Rotaria sp. Silwood2]